MNTDAQPPRRSDHPDFSDEDRKRWARTPGAARSVAKLAGVSHQSIATWRKKWGGSRVKPPVASSVKLSRQGPGGRPDVATSQEKRDLALECQSLLPDVLEVVRRGVAGEPVSSEQVAMIRIVLERGWGKPWQGRSPALGAGKAAEDSLALLAAALGRDG